MNPTNKYLKSSIEEISNFFKNNTNPPEDMYANLLLELRVSNLLIPIVFDGEHISFPHIEVDDGTRLLPLFTNKEELKKYSGDFEFMANEIAYYIYLVKDFGFDGILIDLGSDEFCIEKPLLEKIETLPPMDTKGGLDSEKLKEIALSEKNLPLKRFIEKESNFNRFDELSRLLIDSVILNVVVSEEDLSGFSKNGIIDRNEADTFTLYTKKSGRNHYGAIYTDIDAVCKFHDTLDYFYYVQVTNKYNVFNFVLSNDFDGFVINPGTDDYYIPRQVILRLLDTDLMDSDFAEATRYAFVIG